MAIPVAFMPASQLPPALAARTAYPAIMVTRVVRKYKDRWRGVAVKACVYAGMSAVPSAIAGPYGSVAFRIQAYICVEPLLCK